LLLGTPSVPCDPLVLSGYIFAVFRSSSLPDLQFSTASVPEVTPKWTREALLRSTWHRNDP
jgi:hypothetical protein